MSENEASYEYMVSDNPACAGRILFEKYHPYRMTTVTFQGVKLKQTLRKKVETTKGTIAHDDSLFSERNLHVTPSLRL